ncbi:MAG: fumarylacetoacetase [Acidimicrobiia bacterium]
MHAPEGSDFPIENLPYGVFRRAGEDPRVGVAIGEGVLDLAALESAGVLPGRGVFAADSLNPFMSLGPPAWRAIRERLIELLLHEREVVRRALVHLDEAELLLPIRVADYVDFYSSLEHATNMGRMFRPEAEPLLPNWRYLPVGYHGRSGTVVVSGTPVVRPCGQIKPDDGPPVYAPTRMLDVELEVGFILGMGSEAGEPIPIQRAWEHIFGVVLVNDWSARDIQSWEYVPLGPFLGKSFATSISPWVVTLDALEPYRVPAPAQQPEPLDYLVAEEDRGYDIHLEIVLQDQVISRTNFRHLYWTMAQQLAHATANGARARTGDLYASGTISGPRPGSYGSLIELTRQGSEPLRLAGGAQRSFLEDGDAVVMRGWCEADGKPRIGLGEVRGTVLPAHL